MFFDKINISNDAMNKMRCNIHKRILRVIFLCALIILGTFKTFAEENESALYEIGDIVKFGKYEQDNDTSNGKEEIEWKVLDRNGDYYFLLSNYILDVQPFNVSYTYVTFNSSTLRRFLNNTFYNTAFTGDEKKKIFKTTNKNLGNMKFNIDGGSDTEDYVSVLSVEEYVKYLGDNDAMFENRNATTMGTPYAYKRGLDVLANEDMWCNGFSPYWLRTPGSYRTSAVYVSSNGGYVLWGDAVNYYYGVRPAIWVKLG